MTEAPGGCEKSADYSEGPGYAEPDLLWLTCCNSFLHIHRPVKIYTRRRSRPAVGFLQNAESAPLLHAQAGL